MKRGEIYYIERRHNTVGHEIYSGRPAIIVSNDKNNEHSKTVEVVYLTTQPKRDLPTHVRLRCRGLDGVTKNSFALCEQVNTIDKEQVGDLWCVIDDMSAIDKALSISLGIKQQNNSDDKVARIEADFYKKRYEELLDILKGMRR